MTPKGMLIRYIFAAIFHNIANTYRLLLLTVKFNKWIVKKNSQELSLSVNETLLTMRLPQIFSLRLENLENDNIFDVIPQRTLNFTKHNNYT